MVEHCVSSFRISQQEKIYRIYVTDTLKAISEGKHLTDRFADLIIPQKVDTRTPDEIKTSIINKLKEM